MNNKIFFKFASIFLARLFYLKFQCAVILVDKKLLAILVPLVKLIKTMINNVCGNNFE